MPYGTVNEMCWIIKDLLIQLADKACQLGCPKIVDHMHIHYEM